MLFLGFLLDNKTGKDDRIVTIHWLVLCYLCIPEACKDGNEDGGGAEISVPLFQDDQQKNAYFLS
jgi:hypothetical protein